jgi:putative spermidine/putrescine transport system permease protein
MAVTTSTILTTHNRKSEDSSPSAIINAPAPQLRAARVRKQRIIKAVILLVVLAFLLVPLLAMLLFTVRQPLSGQWGLDAWKAIFTGSGDSLGTDMSILWQGLGVSLALCVVTVLMVLVLLIPVMVITYLRSPKLARLVEWGEYLTLDYSRNCTSGRFRSNLSVDFSRCAFD